MNIKAGCQGKKRFTNWSHAEKSASELRRYKDAKVNPYPCHHCNGFHVGEPSGMNR